MTEQQHYEGPIMVRGKGTGFFALPDAPDDADDILITSDNLGTALDGDIVSITLRPAEAGKRREGVVTEVLERARQEIIGTVKEQNGNLYCQPDNKRIHIRPQLPDASQNDVGMKVAIEITNWTPERGDPTGTIIDTLGKAGDHETEMQAIIRSGGFAESFPEPVAAAAQALYENQDELFAKAVADSQGDQPKRRDMRDVTTCTIDPADAKDFDDALSYRKLDNGNVEIGIHIADVSYYVEEGGIIDQEAQDRGTSIYLVDRVIPMLPEVLSNDLCSLRPNTDRLAFSAVFELDAKSQVKNEWYGQTIIHSDHRFSYEEAQAVLDAGTGELHSELADIMEHGRRLRKERYRQGAIAFEQPEVKFVLDESGFPIEVIKKERIETMLMIEDFMLLANQRVSEYIHTLSKSRNKDAAFIYRIHDTPDPDKIEELGIFLRALGYEFASKGGEVDAKDINTLLKQVDGTPEENLIKTATIRSMAKAVYSTKNIGHFGLAFKYYTHFTSPIRRYPDLMAHRMLRMHLDGKTIDAKTLAKYERLAVQSSERELYAVRAERDSIKYKQVEYMLDKVGQTFQGTITGVADWGIYVEEKESKAEGMIRLASLKNDFYQHESSKYHVKGDKTGSTYALGDEISVKLVRADLEERQLDFELVK